MRFNYKLNAYRDDFSVYKDLEQGGKRPAFTMYMQFLKGPVVAIRSESDKINQVIDISTCSSIIN